MNVYWLEQIQGDVPQGDDWLSAREVACQHALRFAKRRADWTLGRWTAKCAVASYLNLPALPLVLAKIEIRPAASGAPEAFVDERPAAVAISLSHRDGRAICAVAQFGIELGCDLEVVEPRGEAFLSDYFTAGEQVLVARAPTADQTRLVTLLWSAKESTLKALKTGLRLDTRSVMVSPESSFDVNGWSPAQARYTDGRIFYGWWRHRDNILRTLVADVPFGSPISLMLEANSADRASRCA
jgi:4'-phosphopantetheinyl transferase